MISVPLDKNELQKFFDKDAQEVFTFFIFKAIFSQPELLPGQKTIPMQIPKEHIEQWGVQALGADPIGAGSYPVDLVDKSKGYASDIKMLTFANKTRTGKDSKSMSGETSLAQKFAHEDLDKKFVQGRHDEIINAWIDILNSKFKLVFDNYPTVKDIYYFILIREKDGQIKGDNKGKKFHLCGMKVDKLKFCELEHKKDSKDSKDSVWVNNFINEEYGDIKLYKAKKRMELRLKPWKWIETNKVITFDFGSINQVEKKIKGMSDKEKYDFSIDCFKKIYKQVLNYEE